MTDNDETESVNAEYAGEITIGNCSIKCYVAEDGRRILDMDGVHQFLDMLANGYELTQEEALEVASLSKGFKVMEKQS